MSGTMTAMLPVRPVFITCAARFGTKPSLATAASTRRRVSGATFSGRLRVRDTVAGCTPTRAATSRIVTRRCGRTTCDVTRRETSVNDADLGGGCTAVRLPLVNASEVPLSAPTSGQERPPSLISAWVPSCGRISPSTRTICYAAGRRRSFEASPSIVPVQQERLGPQDCYYAVAEREPGENTSAAGHRLSRVGLHRYAGCTDCADRTLDPSGVPDHHREGIRPGPRRDGAARTTVDGGRSPGARPVPLEEVWRHSSSGGIVGQRVPQRRTAPGARDRHRRPSRPGAPGLDLGRSAISQLRGRSHGSGDDRRRSFRRSRPSSAWSTSAP